MERTAQCRRVRFGPFELDVRAGELHSNGQRTILQEQQFKVLLMLIERSGELATREEIKKKLWPNDTIVEFDYGINNTVKNLRRALDDSAERPRYIETIPRRGYRLMVAVEWIAPVILSEDAERSEGEESKDPYSGPGSDSDTESLRKARLAVGRLTGTVVSHYRVLEVIGGGGMGLVYRAEDLKLGRAVALKFLPEEVGDDPKARERFEREAHAVSALDHPNICTVYDFDEHEGHPFLAMQLLQGKTLRDHLADGRFRLTQPEGLEIAIQIALGLEAAHEKGIIHRDIKPANIFITEKNVAKILDFGVAKMVEAPGFSPANEDAHKTSVILNAVEGPAVSSPADEISILNERGDQSRTGLIPAQSLNDAADCTLEGVLHPSSTTLTRTGMALGTAGYMSPEQIRGEPLDARTDIFSFGLVLYEMATGERAFTGNTAAILKDAILNHTPIPVRSLNSTLPPKLEQIIDKATKKDRERRYQHASEITVDLKGLQGTARSRLRWLAFAAIALILVVIAAAVWSADRKPSPLPDLKVRQLTTNLSDSPVRSGAISPDGKYLAYTDTKGIHIRHLDTGHTESIPQPEALRGKPVGWAIVQWFPDGTSFIANLIPPQDWYLEQHSSIWRFSMFGAVPRKLRDDAGASSVSPDGNLIFFGMNDGKFGSREIWEMGPNGEQPRKLFETDESSAIIGPQLLRDGQRLAYLKIDNSGVAYQTRDLRGGSPNTALTAGESSPSGYWLPDGRLLYVLKESGLNDTVCNIWDTRVDPRTGRLTEKARRLTNWSGSCIDLQSATADGKHVVFLQWAGSRTIYVADLQSGGTHIATPVHLPRAENICRVAAWTPDSRAVISLCKRNGQWGIFRQGINEYTAEPIVASIPGYSIFPRRKDLDTSPDGSLVLYAVGHPMGSIHLGPSNPTTQLMRVSIVGGSPELVLTGNLYDPPHCAKSPATICVIAEQSERPKQLIFTAFDPLRGRGRELTRLGIDPGSDHTWALSPDGTRIAVGSNTEGRIHLLPLHGQPPQQLTVKGWNSVDSVAWAANSKALFVSSLQQDSSVLLHVDLRGNAHVLWRQEGGLGTWAAPSPDGRQLAIDSWTLNSNIWMMENF